MILKLYYHISNNGDGSVSINLHPTPEAAEAADTEMDEGWGEPCNGELKFKVDEQTGKVFYRDYIKSTGKFDWIEAIQ